MPIESGGRTANGKPARGWLEIDARWLASLFGVQGTGEVRCVLSKIQVGIESTAITPGQIVEGHFMHAIVPTGVKPKRVG